MSPSFVSPTLKAIDDARLNELFVLQRIRAQLGQLHLQEADSRERLQNLRLKRRWELRRLLTESKP